MNCPVGNKGSDGLGEGNWDHFATHCAFIVAPSLSMAPQWIRHILSLIDTSLRAVSLQAVHPLNTENWLLNASILDLVKFNLRQEHFAYNYVCPGRLFNEQQIAAIIAAAPDLPTRAQAWDYCLALPELQQPANAIDIVFSL